MSRPSGLGMGYLHSDMSRSLSSAGARHIVTRLVARSVAGHSLPIRVHQHYGFQFHLVLRGSSCIRRDTSTTTSVRRICTQLERGLVGLYSCVFDDGRGEVPSWVPRCRRARPLPSWKTKYCSCTFCTPNARTVRNRRWLRKLKQWAMYTSRQVCRCGKRGGPLELLE
jgi:hypothetical protein